MDLILAARMVPGMGTVSYTIFRDRWYWYLV